MLEQEAWGQLTKKQFEKFLKLFSERFREPTRRRRLSISFWNHAHSEVDTRIRITDGQAEIIQKVGTWEGTTQWDRTERVVKLASEAEQVLSAFKIFRQLLPPHEPCQMIQYDNYVFNSEDFEIKLSHQIGKSDKYNFEVEALNDKSDLKTTLEDLGLIDLVTVTDVDFWDRWNQELNINDQELTDVQVKDLIKSYLI